MTMAATLKKYALISLLLLCGCQTVPLETKPLLEHEGEAFVYIQPFEQEADRLSFSLEGISVIKEDGAELPLALSVRDFSRSGIKRQRLIAAGRLPEGTYRGLLFRIGHASLRTDEGSAALMVPEAAVKRDFLFKVERRKALVVSLELQYPKSIMEGVHFRPAWSIAVPPQPVVDLAGYVSDYGSDVITVFDKVKKEVTGVIMTGKGPRGMALDKGRSRLYVALADDDAIEVIDIAEGSTLTTIRLAQGDTPGELALTPDGRTLLAVNTGSDTVSFIDTGALTELDRIAVGKRPRSLLLEKTGRKAYVFNTLSNSVSVIDISGKAVMGEIATGPEPIRGQFNRAGDRLYVAHAEHPYLLIVDPVSFSPIRREFVGTGIRSLKVDPRTDLLYLGKKNDTVIGVYDPLTVSAADYIAAGGETDYMTIEGEGNNLYLVIAEKKTVMIVNLINTRSVSEFDVIDRPSWVVMMGER